MKNKKILGLLIGMLLFNFAGFSQIKISTMPTYTGDPSGSFIPIIVNGVNRKIDAAKLIGSGTTFDSTITATASQTVMPFSNVPSDYSTSIIWRNGVPMNPVSDYTITNSVITFAFPLAVNDIIRYHRTK